MKKLLFTLVFMCISVSSYGSCLKFQHQQCIISIINLISTPEKFHDEIVLVHGVFKIKGSKALLYLNSEMAGFDSIPNRLVIELTNEQKKKFSNLNGQFVQIKGTFVYRNEVLGISDSGFITSVKKLYSFEH